MAKYSTGGSTGGGDGDACELCGEASDSLRRASVAGADLLVCASCAPHDDAAKDAGGSSGSSSDSGNGGEDGGGGPNVPSGSSELWDRDSSRWEKEGTGYESDPLPYLVTEYGQRITDARQEAGLQLDELAEEIGVPEDDLLAIEQGRAARAGVGGSVIAALEDHLDIELAEEGA